MSNWQIIPVAYVADPCILFESISDMPWSMLLDSCYQPALQGRYDIITAQPYVRLICENGQTLVITAQHSYYSQQDPLLLIQQMMPQISNPPADLPFVGGALGYLGYELAYYWQQNIIAPPRCINMPDMAMGIYDWAIVIDHHTQQAVLVAANFDPATPALIDEVLARLQDANHQQVNDFKLTTPFRSNTAEDYYHDCFNRIMHYLAIGDCYQINYTHCFSASFTGNSWNAYKILRQHNPAPYSGYLNLPYGQILSLSPESFLKISDNKVETKPIKGTTPRNPDPSLDVQAAKQLLRSNKDRAENTMIVDLLRNDLGKVCRPGSIVVPHLCNLESFAAVHHLVSTISGIIDANFTPLDVVRACFPGGSITGAPKRRSMEIIAELEIHNRSVYCGTIAFLSYNGKLDSNIAIRTLIACDDKLYCAAGGGIVIDSNEAAEYQETLDKISLITGSI